VSRRQPCFEGETTIVIPGRRLEDTILVVFGVMLLAMMAWAAGDAIFSPSPHDAELLALRVLSLLILVWALTRPITRLRDRRAFFQADAGGLRLHPGFWPRPLAWSDIRSLSIRNDVFAPSRGLNGQIRILLRTPQRTFASPFGAREVRVHLRRLNLSRREAADLLRQLKRLRSQSSSSPEKDQVS
jgi:hypothetical protein